MTLVVCEDDKALLGLIKIIVENEDLELITCSSDTELRQIMNSVVRVDLLVIDYWLKKIKADEIILEIKAIQKDLPIILMSAISDLPTVSKRLGVNDYIKKPFDIEVFMKKINTFLK